jgi:hypothetical protein
MLLEHVLAVLFTLAPDGGRVCVERALVVWLCEMTRFLLVSRARLLLETAIISYLVQPPTLSVPTPNPTFRQPNPNPRECRLFLREGTTHLPEVNAATSELPSRRTPQTTCPAPGQNKTCGEKTFRGPLCNFQRRFF